MASQSAPGAFARRQGINKGTGPDKGLAICRGGEMAGRKSGVAGDRIVSLLLQVHIRRGDISNLNFQASHNAFIPVAVAFRKQTSFRR